MGYTILLSRNTKVIEALNYILRDYNYLFYDISASRNKPYLQVRVVNPDHTEPDMSVAGYVCRELEQMTEICFYVHVYVCEDVWTHFRISEDKLL